MELVFLLKQGPDEQAVKDAVQRIREHPVLSFVTNKGECFHIRLYDAAYYLIGQRVVFARACLFISGDKQQRFVEGAWSCEDQKGWVRFL